MKKPETRNRRRAAALERISDEELTTVAGGGQSTGAGAGKVTFRPFSITKKIDQASPIFFM